MEIRIKIINCQSREEEYRVGEYSGSTTIKEILTQTYPDLVEKLICNIYNGRILSEVDYYFKEGVIHWGVNPYEMLVTDFLKRFPLCQEQGLLCYTEIGGFGDPIDTFFELRRGLELFASNNPVLIGMIGTGITAAVARLKKWLDEKRGRINKNALRNAVHSQKEWSIEQAQKAFATEQLDELIIIMEYAGYHYNQRKNKFIENSD